MVYRHLSLPRLLLFGQRSTRFNLPRHGPTIGGIHGGENVILPPVHDVTCDLLPGDPLGRRDPVTHPVRYAADPIVDVEIPIPQVLTGRRYLDRRRILIEFGVILPSCQIRQRPVVIFDLAGRCFVFAVLVYRFDQISLQLAKKLRVSSIFSRSCSANQGSSRMISLNLSCVKSGTSPWKSGIASGS